METIVTWQLPIKTASEANSSEHWTKKRKRHAVQKGLINWAFKRYWPSKPNINVFHTILTRIAPRSLNSHDNLPCSFKYVVDAIAANLTGNYIPGRADDDERLTWEYRQEKGSPKEYAVKIEIMGQHDNETASDKKRPKNRSEMGKI